MMSSGGDGFTPIVGLSIVAFVQILDSQPHGGETAKHQVAEIFVLMLG
ncbi:hypothetical protein N836_14145 [Leptolyngbya sp. Heron Island J]|nr:hypothetical protein [Leptolyngbya sp. Heron Island J]ESA34898.1 hypothetical protein N836_14145 [Leptolyngbya sp. Heron Island J]